MSRFSDLMGMPLPSQRDMVPYTESDFDEDRIDHVYEDNDDDDDDEYDDVDNTDIKDLEGFDADELSDEELEDLDKELRGEALDSVSSDDEDEDEEKKLTPDEEVEADDMMSVAATSMLVNDELNAEEKAEFAANESEIRTAINEGFMTESDANVLAQEAGLVQENSYNKKMIIRLDAEAKKKQLYALGVNVSAAAHNDPDYRKLRKVMRARKILRERLSRKYHNEALKRMRIYFNRLRKSRSSVLKKIADKVKD